MDLAVYIKELLYRHDCVIIPDLGAIVANYEPAEINYGRKTIYPPGKSILFNRNLKYNDGLLISHIANINNEPFGETQAKLEKKVFEIKSVLAGGNRYCLEDLGYFYPDPKKNILFQPDLKINLMLDSYGMSFIQYRDEVNPVRSLKYRNLSGISQDKHYRAGMRKWIYTAAAASIVTAFALIAIPFGSPGNRLPDNSSVNPFNKERTELTIPEERQSSAMVSSDNAPVNVPVHSSTSVSQCSAKEIHHIITGSYSSFANAREEIHKLRINGWNARLLFTASEVYRVSVFSSGDLEETLNQLHVVRAGINNSAWLYSE